MLKLEDIMAAINLKLKNEFSIDINENDVKEGFERPSFFVNFDEISKIDYLYTFERALIVRIYFFPTNRYKYHLEVLEIQQRIESLFQLGLQVGERFIKIINDIQSDVTDGVLMITFDLSFYDTSYKEPENGKMEELGVNV